MNEHPPSHFCDEATMEQIKVAMQGDDLQALQLLDVACTTYALDPRLTLLRGSIHANSGDYAHARSDFAETLVLAPNLHAARFMLGYLELCHAQTVRALAVWSPLAQLSDDPEMSGYAQGMMALVQDDFSEALERFRASLAADIHHPDIARMVRSLVEQLIDDDASPAASHTHLLLSGYQSRH